MISRRRLISIVPMLGATAIARAQTPAPLVDPQDPRAQTLGYTPDASKVDTTKFPKYMTGQTCSNCALYQGTVGATSEPCPLYAGKAVLANAWCNAWIKRG